MMDLRLDLNGDRLCLLSMSEIAEVKEFVSDLIDVIVTLSYLCYRHDLYQNYEATLIDIRRIRNILAKYDLTLEYLNDIDEIVKDLENGVTPYNKAFSLIRKLKELILDRIEKMSV